MEKAQNLIGLPVLETVSGTQIGEVQEVVVNLEKAIICGIAISGATWFSPELGIFFNDLFAIGQDAVTVGSAGVVRNFGELLDAQDNYCLGEICGKHVYSETGNFLGVLADIGFDSETGEAWSYELSDGLIIDFVYGRCVMPLPKAQIIQADKIIVPEVMAKLIHGVNQGPGGVSYDNLSYMHETGDR